MGNRYALSEQARRLRAEERRDPVEAALYAICALSRDDLARLQARFNETFRTCSPPKSVVFYDGKA